MINCTSSLDCRKLADISRSTRGVVILFCEQKCAIRILEDAKRLNMMDGHFVWLWVDTAETTGQRFNSTAEDMKEEAGRDKRETVTKQHIQSDISDTNRNYLLRNDQYLLFNDFAGPKEARAVRESGGPFLQKTSEASELPSGLLSLKPLPVRVDRHLVKGAARLLIATLKIVLEQCSRCLLEGRLKNSCWINSNEGMNFSNFFARLVPFLHCFL